MLCDHVVSFHFFTRTSLAFSQSHLLMKSKNGLGIHFPPHDLNATIGGTVLDHLIASQEPAIKALTFDLLIRNNITAERLRRAWAVQPTEIHRSNSRALCREAWIRIQAQWHDSDSV